jgi:SAM-dependent methyltransferase
MTQPKTPNEDALPARSERRTMRSVRDDDGFNQGWSGGRATTLRFQRRAQLMVNEMAPNPTGRVLEIGCGRGEIARFVGSATDMQVLGIDRAQSFVANARAATVQSNVRFETADFTEPGALDDHDFNYIIGNGILHHLYYSLDASLRAIHDLLDQNGRIMFLEPNLHNPYVFLIFKQRRLRRIARLEPDEMAFSRAFITQHLRDSGFRDIEVEYRDFLLPGVPDWLIQPLVMFGRMGERTPGLKHLAQSLFIVASA